MTPVVANPASERACPGCGYDLRGINSDRCPECGSLIDEGAIAAAAAVPWARRRSLGVTRAYLETLWMATVHPGRIGRAVATGVSYSDAQRFRWICIFLAFLPVAATLVVWRLRQPKSVMDQVYLGGLNRAMGFFVMPASLAVSLLAIFLFLLLATGLASHFFHPGGIPVRQQNRAVALSYYAAAPLVLIPVPLLLFLIAGWIFGRGGFDGLGSVRGKYDWNDLFDQWHEIAIIASFLFMMVWLHSTLEILRHGTEAHWPKIAGVGSVLLILWPISAVLIFAVLHLVSGFLMLVLTSLTP